MLQKIQPEIVSVKADQFETEVIRRSKNIPVVVCFWSKESKPSKQLLNILSHIQAENEGLISIVKLDVGKEPNLAQEMSVRVLPEVRGYDDGIAVTRWIGLYQDSVIRHRLDPLLRSPASKHALQGLHAFSEGDDERAIREYLLALDYDNHHPNALLALGRLREGQGNVKEAKALYSRIQSDAPQFKAAQKNLTKLIGAS